MDNGSDKRQAPEPEQNSNNRPLYSSNTSNAIPSQTDLTEGSYLLTKSGSLNKPDVYGRFNTESSEQDSRYLLPQNFTVPRNKPVENTILDYVNRAAAGNPSQFGPDLQNLHVTKPQGSSTYTTLSQLQVFNEVGASNRSAQMQLTFPLKLFDIVSDPISDSIIWSDNGTAFHVRDFDDFVSQVLPRHFKRKFNCRSKLPMRFA